MLGHLYILTMEVVMFQVYLNMNRVERAAFVTAWKQFPKRTFKQQLEYWIN